jgi:hypothetical protein
MSLLNANEVANQPVRHYGPLVHIYQLATKPNLARYKYNDLVHALPAWLTLRLIPAKLLVFGIYASLDLLQPYSSSVTYIYNCHE